MHRDRHRAKSNIVCSQGPTQSTLKQGTQGSPAKKRVGGPLGVKVGKNSTGYDVCNQGDFVIKLAYEDDGEIPFLLRIKRLPVLSPCF